MDWPPTLADFLKDQKLEPPLLGDETFDTRIQNNLDAAVAFVERVRPVYNYAADPVSELPDPTDDIKLGTVRLAARWYNRVNSPDGLVSLGEFGAGRVPSFDPDIDRLLGIGRFASLGFA